MASPEASPTEYAYTVVRRVRADAAFDVGVEARFELQLLCSHILRTVLVRLCRHHARGLRPRSRGRQPRNPASVIRFWRRRWLING
jgi:hypothetical protein